jgi:hypothetical protein
LPGQYNTRVQVIEVILPLAEQLDEQQITQRFIGWTGDEPALKLAQSWVENCVNEHHGCGRYEPSPLPDRVIDVSGDVVKLYESNNEKLPYIALSHCWGDTKARCITLKNTLEAQKKNISWDTLPQTFKDAVQVSRTLGVRYIWIDNIVCHILNASAC